jgi:glycine cleavage system H protein
MSDNNKTKSQETDVLRPSTFSRRQALQRMGITVGTGVAAALSLMSACKNPGQTVGPTTSTTSGTTTATEATTGPSTSSNPATPANTSETTTTNVATQTTIPPAATTPNTTGFNYNPPAEPAPVVPVPDSSCTVATDRKYSLEHIWVKTVAPDIAIFGITTTLVAILFEPYKLLFPEPGSKFLKDDGIGEIEGYKVTADLIAPVSGEVLQINAFLKAFVGTALIGPLNDDPYNSGWLLAVKLTNPKELEDLMTPAQYLERLGKLETASSN